MERHKLSGLSFLTNIWPMEPDKPTLFLIHAGGASASSWYFQIQGLTDTANVIAVDLPGHGHSRGPGCDRIVDYAKEAMDLINKMNLEKCIPAGISMGGAVVQEMLVDYLDRFYAGILINTGAKLKVLPDVFDAIKANPRGFMANLINFVLPADLDAEHFGPLMNDILEVKKNIVLGDFEACNNFDIRSRLPEILLPVLIISSGSDTMTPQWYGEYLENNIKDSKHITIRDAGHLVIIEKPEQVNLAISEFVNNLSNNKNLSTSMTKDL
jgi:pimeloyl-ACP methyl ester carboxylesterase